MRQPCMCGAQDCGKCFPGARDLVACHSCGESIPDFAFDDAGWQHVENRDYCPECYEAKLNELKGAVESIILERGRVGVLEVACVVGACAEHASVCIVLKQLKELHLEDLLDVLEDMLHPADQAGLSVSVRLSGSPATNAHNALLKEHLAGWVGQYGCGCDHPTCKACQMRKETRKVIEETK